MIFASDATPVPARMPTVTGRDSAVALYGADASTVRPAALGTSPFICARVAPAIVAVGSETLAERPALTAAASDSACAVLSPVALT